MTCNMCVSYLTDEDENGNVCAYHHDRTKASGFCAEHELFYTRKRNSTACKLFHPDGEEGALKWDRSASYWNSLKKTEETDVRAEPCDLCIEYGNITALIQRRNNFNNVIVQKRSEKPRMQTVRDLAFILTLLPDYGLEYIRIESTKGRYTKLFNRFSITAYQTADNSELTEGREVVYMRLDKYNLHSLWRLFSGCRR